MLSWTVGELWQIRAWVYQQRMHPNYPYTCPACRRGLGFWLSPYIEPCHRSLLVDMRGERYLPVGHPCKSTPYVAPYRPPKLLKPEP